MIYFRKKNVLLHHTNREIAVHCIITKVSLQLKE